MEETKKNQIWEEELEELNSLLGVKDRDLVDRLSKVLASHYSLCQDSQVEEDKLGHQFREGWGRGGLQGTLLQSAGTGYYHLIEPHLAS